MSTYAATIFWKVDSVEGFAANKYSRGHSWEFDGGITVPASSSPHAVKLPYSVENAVDPEEALVASAASCHMLSFLWVVSQNGFIPESYIDNAVGEMGKTDTGKQWIAKITLDPRITWSGEAPDEEKLAHMHHEAHEVCYIANSLKSEIVVKAAA